MRELNWSGWFTADHHGACAGCGDGILPGDTVRADSSDGRLCKDCGREGPA